MNLFLIGYRCSGKTTVGKSLAEAVKQPFVDADAVLVRRYGQHIKEIVDAQGWQAFRRMERSTLAQICEKDRQIVATGGGVVLDNANVHLMKSSGLLIWLQATAETIGRRMAPDENTANFRPPLTDRGPIREIEDMLLQREPCYERASDMTIQTDHRSVFQIVALIVHRTKEMIGE